MNRSWKKMLPAFATSLVAITSCLNAVDDMQMRNLENRVSALEQRRGSNGMINPPARPVVKDGVDLWLQGDALFMHATEDGLDNSIKNANGESFVNGHVNNLNYDWNWGFRVGAGYNLPHDGWDMLLNWTWFKTHAHRHTEAEGAQYVAGSKEYESGPNANFHATKAHSHAHLHMNLVDFEMGREFFVSKWLTVRPHVGARGSWISRHTQAEFEGGSLGSTELQDSFRCRFRGGGLRGGLDSQWGLGSGWSIFGQMAFSLIYGRQKVSFNQEDETTEVEQAFARDRWTNVRGITDLGLGLRWDQLFFSDRYRIRLQLGWEQHLFFGFHKDMVFVDNVAQHTFVNNTGDLALSGVSFQARFDF